MPARRSSTLELSPAARKSALTLVQAHVRVVPDFPKPGILFRDITPVLGHAGALQAALDLHVDSVADLAGDIDRVVAIESRGFLFGMALAARLGVGFAPARKPGKLPARTAEQSYELEYGTDALQIHIDALDAGSRVLLVDDLLATGGTASAAVKLIERLEAHVTACLFLIELDALAGRSRLGGHRVEALLQY